MKRLAGYRVRPARRVAQDRTERHLYERGFAFRWVGCRIPYSSAPAIITFLAIRQASKLDINGLFYGNREKVN
jgi:hypothetical protein